MRAPSRPAGWVAIRFFWRAMSSPSLSPQTAEIGGWRSRRQALAGAVVSQEPVPRTSTCTGPLFVRTRRRMLCSGTCTNALRPALRGWSLIGRSFSTRTASRRSGSTSLGFSVRVRSDSSAETRLRPQSVTSVYMRRGRSPCADGRPAPRPNVVGATRRGPILMVRRAAGCRCASRRRGCQSLSGRLAAFPAHGQVWSRREVPGLRGAPPMPARQLAEDPASQGRGRKCGACRRRGGRGRLARAACGWAGEVSRDCVAGTRRRPG